MSSHSSRQPYFSVLLACAFTTGCAMQPVYGAAWADQVKVESGACPDIDGEYENSGERFAFDSHERQVISLAHILNGGNAADSHEADDRLGLTTSTPTPDSYQAISLHRVDDKLHVEGKRADGSAKAFDLPTRGRCRNSTLLVDVDWGGASFVIVSGVARNTLALGRAEDGSLLVRDGGSGALFLFWIPIIAGSASDWTIFHPVVPAPEKFSVATP